MKHIKIVLSLLVVVVVFTGLVFFVESFTTPQINARLTIEANEAKFEVLPSLMDAFDLEYEIPNVVEEYDVTGTTVIGVYQEEGHGYIYEAQFQGYQSKISYMIGISEEGEITGLKVLKQGDTPGLGAEIGNPDNWKQFVGMSLNAALTGNIDGLTGATVTTDGWKDSLSKVVDFHSNTVLGFIYTDVTDDVTVSAVTKAEEVSKDGTLLEVIYTVEFESNYSSGPNVYNVSFKIGEGIKKLEIIEATDTDIYGAHIGDPEFAAQFSGMTMESALNSEYDDLGGATYPITLGAFGGTFDQLVAFHNVEYEGATPETFEEMVVRYKEEVSVKGGTFVDVTADYDLGESFITKLEEVTPEGEMGATHLVVSFTFPGHVDDINAIAGINIDDGKLNGLRITAQNETQGIGDRILEEDFLAQFDNLNILGAKLGIYDAIGGSSSTTGRQLTAGFDSVITWYQAIYLGEGVVSDLTEAQILQQKITDLFPAQFSISDITFDHDTTGTDVEKVLRINDIDGNILGYVFVAEGVGASFSEPTTIKYIIAINPDKTFAGFEMLEDNETPGRADPYYLVEYANQFVGVDIEVDGYPIDAVAQSTMTHNAIMDSALNIARFFVEEVLGEGFNRPAPTVVAQGVLELAFPGADTFTSIYLAMDLADDIVNVYEAYNGATLLGHVYIGEASGFGGTIQFAWGINITGISEQIEIITQNETWNLAEDHASYDGSSGYFPITPWLASQFEGIDIANITTTETIDDVAGVSTTTSGLRETAEAIVVYHNANVGGGS